VVRACSLTVSEQARTTHHRERINKEIIVHLLVSIIIIIFFVLHAILEVDLHKLNKICTSEQDQFQMQDISLSTDKRSNEENACRLYAKRDA
jgi:hypothetical protein